MALTSKGHGADASGFQDSDVVVCALFFVDRLGCVKASDGAERRASKEQREDTLHSLCLPFAIASRPSEEERPAANRPQEDDRGKAGTGFKSLEHGERGEGEVPGPRLASCTAFGGNSGFEGERCQGKNGDRGGAMVLFRERCGHFRQARKAGKKNVDGIFDGCDAGLMRQGARRRTQGFVSV